MEVTQRLKRIPTIVDKLRREPTMQPAKMQDIGGCRSILRSLAEIRRVEWRLCRNRPPLRVSDYVAVLQASGYRAVHVVVSYPDEDGVARAIEVQLRTRIMHECAVSVERLGGRIETDVQSGLGARPVLDFLRTASAAMAIDEAGGTVARELEAEVVALRAAAMPYLEGTSRRSRHERLDPTLPAGLRSWQGRAGRGA